MPVERFASGGIYEDEVGYSRVVVASGYGGHTGWTAGTTAMVNGVVAHPGDALGQALVAFQAALFALERAGFSRTDTVQTRMYVVDVAANADAVGRAHSAALRRHPTGRHDGRRQRPGPSRDARRGRGRRLATRRRLGGLTPPGHDGALDQAVARCVAE